MRTKMDMFAAAFIVVLVFALGIVIGMMISTQSQMTSDTALPILLPPAQTIEEPPPQLRIVPPPADRKTDQKATSPLQDLLAEAQRNESSFRRATLPAAYDSAREAPPALSHAQWREPERSEAAPLPQLEVERGEETQST